MRIFVVVLGAGLLAASPGYAQDAAAGEKIFVQCKACHQIGETANNAVGPILNGVIGRKAGTIAGYSYSSANKNSGITWDEATFRGPAGQDPRHQDDLSRCERSEADRRSSCLSQTIRRHGKEEGGDGPCRRQVRGGEVTIRSAFLRIR